MELLNLTRLQLEDKIESLGYKKFRARQIFKWVYKQFIFDFKQMTDIAKADRENLENIFSIAPLDDPEIFLSADGTEKYRFTLNDGAQIESVLIPEKDRLTLCVSTQVGCSFGCAFCRTGSLGFKRNLSAGEISGQALYASIRLDKRQKKLTNIVYMGMGEPLANIENTINSIEILMDDLGLNLSARRITVSTVGLVDKLAELGARTPVNLALSLHAVDDKTREKIMPVAAKYQLKDLFAALLKYPMPNRKRLLIEYIMLDSVNDSLREARELVKIARRLNAKVNLIPFNKFDNTDFIPSPMEKILAFQKILLDSDITTIIRKSKGDESLAACGQLGCI